MTKEIINKSTFMKKIFLLFLSFLAMYGIAVAQDSTAAQEKETLKPKYTRATFNSTRIINMQSTEMIRKGGLQFLISHHFSYIWNKGAGSENLGQFFGLNSGVAHTYLSFDYTPKTWLNLGVAMAGSSKYEAWAKFKLLRQQTGVKNIPVSVALFSLGNINTAKDPDHSFAGNKMAFMNQLLISRKFSDKISLQLMPAWIHFNIVPYGINNSNEVFSLGLAGKYKATSNLNLTLEYSRQLNMYENLITKNGSILSYQPNLLSAGIEVNTGGHLFQFYVGNTISSSNIDQLARNTSSIKDGNFAFGFTINRSF